MRERVLSNIGGVKVDTLRTAEVLNRLEEFIREGGPHQVAYANAESVNRAIFDRRYREILDEADLVYPDGMGVVWASRFSSRPLPERVNLGDFLPELCRLSAEKGYRLFLLGGRRGVAEEAASNLKKEFPQLDIAGVYHGYFGEREDDKICEIIKRDRPHILLVGMGLPRQEKWIKRNISKLNVPVVWGVGGLFDYYSLRIKRAPVFIRRMGIEWLFRLMMEPARLWRRYILGNIFFILHTFLLLILDAVLLAIGWVGAYWLRYALNGLFPKAINPFRPYIIALPFIIALWMVSCMYFGLYKPSRSASGIYEQSSILRASIMGLLIVMALSFLFKEFEFGRAVVLISGGLNLISLNLSRVITHYVDERIIGKSRLPVRVAIVGCGKLADSIRREIEDSPDGYRFIGYIDDKNLPPAERDGESILGSILDIDNIAEEHKLQEIYIASDRLGLEQKLGLIERYAALPVRFKLASRHLKEFAERVSVEMMDGVPLLDFEKARSSRLYDVFKSISDMIAAPIILISLFPVLVVVAAAIKLDSRGPVLFKHKRIGKGGRPFNMYKFRTMRRGVSEQELAPNKLNDPRVTRFGRLLRRLSIDEIPQFFNVLRGDMAIVGPRPEMPFIVENYSPWQRRRLDIKPGITGLWQVAGRKELTLHKNLEYDIYYVNHRSFILDTLILIKTIPAVIFRRGAY